MRQPYSNMAINLDNESTATLVVTLGISDV